MKPRPLDLTAVIVLVLICAIWGGNQTAIKIANEGIPPILQAGLRSVASGVLLAGWCLVRGVPFLVLDRTLPWGLLTGTLFTLEFVCVYVGLSMTDVSRAVLYIYLSPFVAAVGAHFLVPEERLTPVKIGGLLLAFGSVCLVFSSGLTLPRTEQLIGDLLCLIMGVIWGIETVVIKVSPLNRISPERVLLYNLVISAAALTAISHAVGEPAVGALTPRVLAAFGYSFVLVSFFSYVTFVWLLWRYEAAVLASFIFLSPIFGVLIAALLLGETLSPVLLVALAMTALGIFLVNRPGSRRPATIAEGSSGP